jgi:hypothetical protein
VNSRVTDGSEYRRRRVGSVTLRAIVILLCSALVAMTGSNSNSYLVRYDSSFIDAERLALFIERFAISKGFRVVMRSEEYEPTARRLTELEHGVTYRGGVRLRIERRSDGIVHLDALELHHAACSQGVIEGMDAWARELEAQAPEAVGARIELVSEPGGWFRRPTAPNTSLERTRDG